MKNLYKLVLTAAMLLSSILASAVPADTRPINVRQKDGTTITIIRYGDEFYHYTTTADGYLITQVDDIYYYATVDGSGVISSTGVAAKNPSMRTSEDRNILSRVSRGVPTSVADYRAAEARREKAVDSPYTLDKLKAPAGNGYTRSVGERKEKVIVLLAAFPDKGFVTENANAAFHSMLNDEGYNKSGATGSARDYYLDQSYGLYDLDIDVAGPFVLPNNMAYYGGNDSSGSDKAVPRMIADVCALADATVDFREYAEGGYITRIFVYFAGHNEAEGASANTVWPHRWVVYPGYNCDADTPYVFDGVRLYDYACSSELRGWSGNAMAHIGTFCHEYGHCIGLADYYNTSYNPGTVNFGSLSLMCGGNYNNDGATPPELGVYERYFLGWLEPKELPSSGPVTLEPMAKEAAYILHTDTNNEFFMFENRDMSVKWNRYISSNAPTGGMLVYHVDRSNNTVPGTGRTAKQLWDGNEVNNYAAHECYKIVRASKTPNTNNGQWFFPGRANSYVTLTDSSNTEFLQWSGKSLGYTLNNITYVSSTKNVTFDVETPFEAIASVKVVDSTGSPIAGADVVLNMTGANGVQSMFVNGPQKVTEGIYYLTTDALGMAQSVVISGEYEVTVSKSNYQTKVVNKEFPVGTTTLNVTLNASSSSATGMTFNQSSTELTVGEVEVIEYTLTPAGSTGDVVWKSSNNNVAVVDAGGILRIVGAGNANITATVNGKAATGSLAVTATPEVKLEEPEISLQNDGNSRAVIRWEPIETRKGWNLYVKSDVESNYTVYTLEGDETSKVLQNLGKGQTIDVQISSVHSYMPDVMWGTVGMSFTLEGELIEPEDISLNYTEKTILVGESINLIATVTPEGNYDSEVEWSLSNSNVGTITDKGKFTAEHAGTVTVTATTKLTKLTAECVITVKDAVSDISVEPYYNDVVITWEGIADAWNVVWYSNSTNSKQMKVTEPMVYIDCLQHNTSYTVEITPIIGNKEKSEDKQIVTVRTDANTGSYASLMMTGNYSASDLVPLHVANVQGTLESITWKVDGQVVTPPSIKISAGRHKIEAIVKTLLGEEKLIKYVTIIK